MNKELILKEFKKLTEPEISIYELPQFKTKQIRIVLPFNPNLTAITTIDNEFYDDNNESYIAQSLKEGIDYKFNKAQELERLFNKPLIKIVCWLLHYG
jgi:hypothetical protein